MMLFFFFFFQAEDGIRDLTVTGVQTCALPILQLQQAHSSRALALRLGGHGAGHDTAADEGVVGGLRSAAGKMPHDTAGLRRSEERRVGKECRSRWSPDH